MLELDPRVLRIEVRDERWKGGSIVRPNAEDIVLEEKEKEEEELEDAKEGGERQNNCLCIQTSSKPNIRRAE